jgi:probable HAF family extracellular repeat protein
MLTNTKPCNAILLSLIVFLSFLGCERMENETPSSLMMPTSPSQSLLKSDFIAASGVTTSTTGVPMIYLDDLVNPKLLCANGVNSLGNVVGEGLPWDLTGAFLWSRQYGVKYLGTFGGERNFSMAFDINDLRQVVGWSLDPIRISHRAFLWSDKGGMVNLGTAEVQDDPDNPFSMAYAINNRGEIVGETGNYAFLWTNKRGMKLLSTLQPYWLYSTAWDINDNGKIVGMCLAFCCPSRYHAVLWTDVGKIQDLGTLKQHSQALGINILGQIVGGSSDNLEGLHERIGSENYNTVFNHSCVAFIWTEKNGMAQLPMLGGDAGCAHAINDKGQVVGWSYTTEGKVHAYVWTSKNGIQDLGTLPGDDQSVAYGINNLGQVVGCSMKMHEDGINMIRHAVIWALK